MRLEDQGGLGALKGHQWAFDRGEGYIFAEQVAIQMLQEVFPLASFQEKQNRVFAFPMKGERGDQACLAIHDGAVLPLSLCERIYIISGLRLKKIEYVLSRSTNEASVRQ